MKGEIELSKADIDNYYQTELEKLNQVTTMNDKTKYRKNCNYLMFNYLRDFLEDNYCLIFQSTNSKRSEKTIQIERFISVRNEDSDEGLSKTDILEIGTKIYTFITSLIPANERITKYILERNNSQIESIFIDYFKEHDVLLHFCKSYW